MDGVVSLEVLDGWTTPDGARMVGLKLQLAPGWKTYWRAPGDAGIPPQFGWRGSENLRGVRVHWPRPEIHDQNGYRTLGYHGEVVLPVEMFAQDPSRPIAVNGQLAIGICKDICMPMHMDYSALLPPSAATGAGAAAIRAALEARPVRADAAGLRAATCTVTPIKDGVRLVASLPVRAQGGTEAVVVESTRQDLWISETVSTRSGGDLTARADFVPPEGKPFALDRSGLRFTVIGRDGAVDLRGCTPG